MQPPLPGLREAASQPEPWPPPVPKAPGHSRTHSLAASAVPRPHGRSWKKGRQRSQSVPVVLCWHRQASRPAPSGLHSLACPLHLHLGEHGRGGPGTGEGTVQGVVNSRWPLILSLNDGEHREHSKPHYVPRGGVGNGSRDLAALGYLELCVCGQTPLHLHKPPSLPISQMKELRHAGRPRPPVRNGKADEAAAEGALAERAPERSHPSPLGGRWGSSQVGGGGRGQPAS